MIAELGLGALWIAAALSLLQLFFAAGALRDPDDGGMVRSVRPLAVAQAVIVLIAFASLILLFMRSDMSVQLVAENSHSAKPWIYKFAGTWGNHEGSMLLWVTVLALAGAAV